MATVAEAQTPTKGTPRWVAHRLRHIVEHEGLRGLWFRTWAHLGYRRLAFLTCPLNDAVAPQSVGTSLQFVTLGRADADEYAAFREGARAGEFASYLQSEFVCHAARVDGRLASVTWSAANRATIWYLDADFDLRPGQLYLFGSYTHPNFRGRRLHAALFDHVRRWGPTAGFSEAAVFVVAENAATLRAHARVGFQRTGAAVRIRLGPFIRHFSQGNAPRMRPRRGVPATGEASG